MHAIQVKCPNCAAVLRVSADAMTVSCDYCHTQSHVQRRTRMLQRPVKMPPPPRRGVPVRAARQVVRRSIVAVTVIAGLLPFVGFGAVFFAMRRPFEQAAEVVKDALNPAARSVGAIASGRGRGGGGGADHGDGSRWVGISAPLFADADRDGVADVIGRVRHVRAGDHVNLVAISGATGERLWKSAALGTYSDTIASRTSVVGDLILFTNRTGALSGFELGTGERRFTVSLPDRAGRFCRKGDGKVAVVTADGTWHEVSVADGAARKIRREKRCDELVHDERGEAVDPALSVASPRRSRQAGMRLHRELRRGRGLAVAVGSRARGTAVPMVAGLDARRRVTWKAELPDGRPLEASQGAGLWTVTGRLACGMYQRTGSTSSHHVTCFGLADGERAWDLDLGKAVTMPLTSLVSSGERLYLSGWGLLLGIDGATGTWLPGLGP